VPNPRGWPGWPTPTVAHEAGEFYLSLRKTQKFPGGLSRFCRKSRLQGDEEESMTQYVLIESRDPFESRDTEFVEQTAITIKERGHRVTVFLLQNGVFAARKTTARLQRLTDAGVILLADDFSLRERGIKTAELARGFQESGINSLVDMITQPDTKAIWH
jgi:sulfur relay (sulfurtransferase) complex TusBCD TusD component (DsrE family)